MPAPTNLRDLIAHLQANPRVRMTCDAPRMTFDDVCRFERFENGLAWFRDEATGKARHLPIACGRPAAELHETGLTFRDDGFDMEKFGITIRVDYIL